MFERSAEFCNLSKPLIYPFVLRTAGNFGYRLEVGIEAEQSNRVYQIFG